MPNSSNNTTQINVGGPESFASPMNSAENPTKVSGPEQQEQQEFGYERIKKIEQQQDETLKDIERKDRKRVQADPKQQQQNNQQPRPVVSVPGPKFFGYRISPQTSSNISDLKDNKGKGDESDAKTWVYMLLDRMLKKQTYSSENS